MMRFVVKKQQASDGDTTLSNLSDSQRLAYEFLLAQLAINPVVLLEGAAGTGKTRLASNFIEHFVVGRGAKVCI